MAAPVRPGVPTVPLSYKFVQINYNGQQYNLKVNLDLNSRNFLRTTQITYGGNLASSNIAYPTDDQNRLNAMPWGGPFSPVGGGGKAATRLFNEVTNSAEAKQAVANELSSLYGTVSPQIQQEWQKSAHNAGTNTTLQQIKPGPGVFDPNTQQQPITKVPVGAENGPTNVALPEEIANEIIAGDEKTIQSLSPPKSKEPIILVYPVDASYSNTQDHVVIEQFSYRAPQQNLFVTGQNLNTTNFSQIVTQGLTRNSNLRNFIGLVKLPIPNQLAMSNGVSWGEDRANPIEAAAFFGALDLANNAIGGNIGDFFNTSFSGLGQLLDRFNKGGFSSGTPAGLLLSSFLAQYGLSKVGINVDPAQFIARGTGTTINPNLELLFNGPKLRSFSFTFEFAPNSINDAKGARRVMRFFKQGMAPKRFESTTIFIGSPNVFRVSYRGTGDKNIKGLNRFKICALTACEVNYTPEGVYQSYDDPDAVSMPVRTNMTLSFTELTPIFEQDYMTENDPSIQDILNPLGSPMAASQSITYDDIGF